ncbi:MAG: 30S ribosomal protein S20 [Gemmatimonadetes bacterium]|nr:30S ribosomal protein S20 [Gemmatimonadota bacterium]
MPQHKSCEKRVRTNAKANLRNRIMNSRIRTLSKKIGETDSKEEGKKVLLELLASLDKAAKKNLMHKNQVARRKSRAQRIFNAIG